MALNQKDAVPPYRREDLYSSLMWTMGVLLALKSEGYIIEKPDRNTT